MNKNNYLLIFVGFFLLTASCGSSPPATNSVVTEPEVKFSNPVEVTISWLCW